MLAKFLMEKFNRERRKNINISITGHLKVEIKVFQDVKMFIPTIENEIKRQKENIKKNQVLSLCQS